MFIDAIANFAQNEMGPMWSHSFEFLNSLRSQVWAEDRIEEYEILKGHANIKVLSYKTQLFPSRMYRARPRHITVETMLQGQEKISWMPLDSVGVPVTNRFKEMDIYQTSQKGVREFVLTPERFAVFYPQDAYMNRLAIDEQSSLVVKAVITIPVSVLEEGHTVFFLTSLMNASNNSGRDCYERASSF